MKNEITWEQLQRESGYPHPIEEWTTVTRKLRRVARFDWDLAARCIQANRPTRTAVNGIDYLNYKNKSALSVTQLSDEAVDFLNRCASMGLSPVSYLGVGPGVADVLEIPPACRFSDCDFFSTAAANR